MDQNLTKIGVGIDGFVNCDSQVGDEVGERADYRLGLVWREVAEAAFGDQKGWDIFHLKIVNTWRHLAQVDGMEEVAVSIHPGISIESPVVFLGIDWILRVVQCEEVRVSWGELFGLEYSC